MEKQTTGFEVARAPSDDFSVVTYHQDTQVERSLGALTDAIALEGDRPVRRILMDVSSVRSACSRAEQYKFCLRVSESGIRDTDRIAALVPADTREHDFVEMSMQDLGYCFKSFRTLEVARSWLLSDDPPY